jgi:hypothetical protein
MAFLTNAERQRLFRERRKAQLQDHPSEASRLREENDRLRAALRIRSQETGRVALTAEQEGQRDLLIGDLLSDRSWEKLPRKTPPKFMGMTREEWMHTKSEVQEHFGLAKAIETAGRIMRLELHSKVENAGRRFRPTKRKAAAFGR